MYLVGGQTNADGGQLFTERKVCRKGGRDLLVRMGDGGVTPSPQHRSDSFKRKLRILPKQINCHLPCGGECAGSIPLNH